MNIIYHQNNKFFLGHVVVSTSFFILTSSILQNFIYIDNKKVNLQKNYSYGMIIIYITLFIFLVNLEQYLKRKHIETLMLKNLKIIRQYYSLRDRSFTISNQLINQIESIFIYWNTIIVYCILIFYMFITTLNIYVFLALLFPLLKNFKLRFIVPLLLYLYDVYEIDQLNIIIFHLYMIVTYHSRFSLKKPINKLKIMPKACGTRIIDNWNKIHIKMFQQKSYPYNINYKSNIEIKKGENYTIVAQSWNILTSFAYAINNTFYTSNHEIYIDDLHYTKVSKSFWKQSVYIIFNTKLSLSDLKFFEFVSPVSLKDRSILRNILNLNSNYDRVLYISLISESSMIILDEELLLKLNKQQKDHIYEFIKNRNITFIILSTGQITFPFKRINIH